MSEDEATRKLNELLGICEDGEVFYTYAAQEIENPALQAFFEKMADIRESVIEDLSAEVVIRGGAPQEGGTLHGKVRKVYARLKKSLMPDTDRTLVEQLEEVENRTLQAFNHAIEKTPTPELKEVLESHLKKFIDTHKQMKTIKQTT